LFDIHFSIKMDIIRIYEEKKENVERDIRILGDTYHFHPREAAIRLASARGELRNAIMEYEMNPELPVFDYNEWNTKSFEDIIFAIMDGTPALDPDDFISPNGVSSFPTSIFQENCSTDKVIFQGKKKKSGLKKLFSKKKTFNKDDFCGVCRETTIDWKTDCSHNFCDKCAKSWFEQRNKTACPLCRRQVKICSGI